MIDTFSNWRHMHSELPEGWAGQYELFGNGNVVENIKLYKEIVVWLLTNVSRPHSNARWCRVGNCISVQLRKSADYQWFLLRWAKK